MQKTTNLNLHKPELTDAPPDITVLNENWDTLDAGITAINNELPNKADKDLGNVTEADFLATIDRTEAIPYIFAANKADIEEAVAGADDVKYMTPLTTKEAIDASTPYRVGDIRFLGYPLSDDKYLPCNGQLLDMVDYPELYATVGTYYGGVEPLEDLTEKNLGFVVNDLAAGNGLLVAVGTGGQIAVSGDNGATWTQQNSGITYAVGEDSVHVVYGNGIFIIYGYHRSGGMVPRNDVYGTGDGTWNQRSTTSMGLYEPNHYKITYDMAYGNNLWMRVGTDIYYGGAENVNYAMIYSSTDNGDTWSEIAASDLGDEKIMSVSYGGGVFRTVGDLYRAGSPRTIGKYNGTSWSKEYAYYTHNQKSNYHWINRLKYVDDEWLGMGYYATYGKSTTHIYKKGSYDWEAAATLDDYYNILDISKSSGLYICAGEGGVASSSDGINWRIKDSAAKSTRIIYSGGTWFIVLKSGKLVMTTENYGQFYLPTHNNTMPHCYIKAMS